MLRLKMVKWTMKRPADRFLTQSSWSDFFILQDALFYDFFLEKINHKKKNQKVTTRKLR